MELNQIRTLYHKRYLLVTNLIIDDDVINSLLRLKLLTAKMAASLQREPSNVLKVSKYLRLLEGSDGLGKNVFHRFCQFLLVQFPLILDEVKVELQAVRGDLPIERYMREEARVLVQHEFDDMKRLKDFEKKEIENLVATRMQVYKEIWSRAIREATCQLQKEKLDNMTKRGFLTELEDRLENFIRISDKDGSYTSRKQKRAIKKPSDIEGTNDALTKMTQVVEDIDMLKELSLKDMAARSNALEEKSRALRMIGVSSTLTRLDKEVKAFLEPLDQEVKEMETQLILRQHQTEMLRTTLREIENGRKQEQEDLDEQIRILEGRMEISHQESGVCRSEMFQLQRQLARVMEHLTRYQSKSSILYRGRTMGYATKEVLENVKGLKVFMSPRLSRSQLRRTPRLATCSRSRDR